MKNLIKVLNEITNEKIIVSARGGSPIINTNQRSVIKQRIEKAFLTDLQEIFAETDLVHIIGRAEKGIMLAIEHNDLVDNAKTEGEIALEFNIKVSNLDFDTDTEIRLHTKEQANKEIEKQEKALAKKRKIARDKKDRADRKKIKEQKLAKLNG